MSEVRAKRSSIEGREGRRDMMGGHRSTESSFEGHTYISISLTKFFILQDGKGERVDVSFNEPRQESFEQKLEREEEDCFPFAERKHFVKKKK